MTMQQLEASAREAVDWSARADAALAAPVQERDPGFEWVEEWCARFNCSESNAFLRLRKMVKAGLMEARKYRVVTSGRPSHRHAWKPLGDWWK